MYISIDIVFITILSYQLLSSSSGDRTYLFINAIAVLQPVTKETFDYV